MGDDTADDHLERAGLRALSGLPPEDWQRQARIDVLASDIDEDAGAAAVWLVQYLGSPDAAEHLMEFERIGNDWQCLGWSGGSAREISLTNRPSAAVAGVHAILVNCGNCASRSRADRNAIGGELDPGRVGWVAAAAFRVAAEVTQIQFGARQVRVPEHGYVIVAWKAPPSLQSPARLPVAALAADGSRLTEMGPGQHIDSSTWAEIEAIIADG